MQQVRAACAAELSRRSSAKAAATTATSDATDNTQTADVPVEAPPGEEQ